MEGSEKKAFTVYREWTEPVVTYERRREVVLETDDWVEAERAAAVKHWRDRETPNRIAGTHPTHDMQPVDTTTKPEGWRGSLVACATCGMPDNGCYGSHAPCGYDFAGRSLVDALEDEEAAHV